MIRIASPTQAQPEPVDDGEYILRLLGCGTNHDSGPATPMLRFEILEGDCDGRRITLELAPSQAACFRSARQVERLAARGACYMSRVATKLDSRGYSKSLVTDLELVGYEPTELGCFVLN